MAIRAALIDMDGTIWVSPVRMAEVRRELGLPEDGRPLLVQLAELPPEEQARGIQVLRRHEARAVALGALRPGTGELLAFLRGRGVKCVLVTNNSRESATAVLARSGLPFNLVFTRDNGPMKPAPAAFLQPLEELGVLPAEAVVIGDSHFDLIAAHEAGIAQVILVRPEEWMRPFFPPEASYHEVQDLAEARDLLARWVP
ncbi:MAG: HAD family hydrolase [Candidatus Acetothermia bacterium]|jgi:HAD superfamily hydrolase (TIGR01509 family)|nr:HAD family hydrolase [Candidatus Acetothermia bacterium]